MIPLTSTSTGTRPTLLAPGTFPPAPLLLHKDQAAPVGREDGHVLVLPVVHAVEARDAPPLLDVPVVLAAEEHGEQLQAPRQDGRPAPPLVLLVVHDKELVRVLVLLVKVGFPLPCVFGRGGGGSGSSYSISSGRGVHVSGYVWDCG